MAIPKPKDTTTVKKAKFVTSADIERNRQRIEEQIRRARECREQGKPFYVYIPGGSS